MKSAEKFAKKYLKQEIISIETSNRKIESNSLTIYEKAIIYKYANDGYEDLNESLRVSKGKSLGEFGKLLDTSLSKLPDFDGLVYRGVNLTKDELQVYINALKNNERIKEYSFISTSKSRLIAIEFRGNCLFRIYSRTGKEIEKIAKFGLYGGQNEKEVLFRPNRDFRILEIKSEIDYTLITMEEV